MTAYQDYLKKTRLPIGQIYSDGKILEDSLNKASFECRIIENSSNWKAAYYPQSSVANSTISPELSMTYLKVDPIKKKQPQFNFGRIWGVLVCSKEIFNHFEDSQLKSTSLIIITPWADACFDYLLRQLTKPRQNLFETQNFEFSQIHESAILAPNVSIGYHSVVGAGVQLDPGVVLYPGTVVGPGTHIAANSIIGSQGFGLSRYPDSPLMKQKIHVGRVRIGQGVRIGSVVTIDRATLDETIIGDGVCIDNQVQIAHNCQIGAGSVICAFAGISGSTVFEPGVVFGPMSATSGHLTIASGTTIAGMTGITKSVNGDRGVWKGHPAMPLKDYLKTQASLKKLALSKKR